MFEIKYEIKLNDNGRPCVDLPEEYEDKPEDKFFVMELSRYVLTNVYNRRSHEFDPVEADKLLHCINVLGQVSDEIAALLYGQMVSMGDIQVTLGGSYHILVKTIEERDAIPETGFVYEGKIFNRQEGLRVKVIDVDLPIKDLTIQYFELQGGITNNNWIEIT